MNKVMKCDCGFVIRGRTDDELVEAAQSHAKDVHSMDLTPEQILSMAEPEE